MVGAVLSFLDLYKWTFLFYAALILLIFLFRKKFAWQGIIGLYRTKLGLKAMDRLGKGSNHEQLGNSFLTLAFPLLSVSVIFILLSQFVTFPEGLKLIALVALTLGGLVYFFGLCFRPIKLAGIHAMWVGFAGMLFIVLILAKGLYDVFFRPELPPPLSPILPGVAILGTGLQVPLIIGWLALFLVIVIHEFSHGVVARAHKIPVKSSGLMLFGPIGGAFVEPDEKRLQRRSTSAQLSVFAAGPFSNLLLALAVTLLLFFILSPLINTFLANDGVVFQEVVRDSPAAVAGVKTGIVYDAVNSHSVSNSSDVALLLKELKPGDAVVLSSSRTGDEVTVIAGEDPKNATRGRLGVIYGHNLKQPRLNWLFQTLLWFAEFLTWTFILSLGIGLANLLPLGPVDGGRILQVVSERFLGKKEGKRFWVKVTVIVIIVIIILLAMPFVVRPLLTLF